MSRLILLCSSLFALLILFPSAPARTRVGASAPARTRVGAVEDAFDSVQLEEPPETIDGENIPLGPGRESEWIESGNPDCIPQLIRWLRSHEEVAQGAALAEFAGMGAKAKVAVPALLDALSDPKSVIRVLAAATLIHMNVRSRAALRTLQNELKTEKATDRAYAVWTIGQLIEPLFFGSSCWGPDPPPRVARPWVGKRLRPALVEALADQDAKVRVEAAHVLGLLGPDAKATLTLTRALRDEDDAVRKTAKKALQKINRRSADKNHIP